MLVCEEGGGGVSTERSKELADKWIGTHHDDEELWADAFNALEELRAEHEEKTAELRREIETLRSDCAAELARYIGALERRAEDSDTIQVVWAQIERQREAMKESAEIFRQYEELHLAKGTEEGARKAASNAEAAARLEKLLDHHLFTT
jgi:hypothetical protein